MIWVHEHATAAVAINSSTDQQTYVWLRKFMSILFGATSDWHICLMSFTVALHTQQGFRVYYTQQKLNNKP